MKVVYRTAVRTFLCTCLLLGSVALARAQAATGQQAAPTPDNTTDQQATPIPDHTTDQQAVPIPDNTTAQQAPAPDNTKVNERDRSADEPTADQQKDNRSDRYITQQIRQSIMKDKSLSTYAHNVKIITQNGQVTLTGPVRSEEEKKTVEAKATEVAGRNKVTSELNINPQQNN